MSHVVLTGSVRIGKTTICQTVIDLVRKQGYCVVGILTPPILDRNGHRIGIEVVDLTSGERKALAQVVPHKDESDSSPEQAESVRISGSPLARPKRADPKAMAGFSGPRVGDYQFDATALQWGQDVVARAIAIGCDLLVVDEIGRLELEHNVGFGRVLESLETGVVPRSLLVVRRELLDKFRSRLPELQFVTFEAAEANRRHLASQIVDNLFLS
jgi:nucleoside-triphosphatase THEP1